MLFRTPQIVTILRGRYRGCLSRSLTAHSSGAGFADLLSTSEALDIYNNGAQSVKFLDCSWHLDKKRNGHTEYLQQRIAGAQFFDIDEAADKRTNLPHMIPSEDQFSEYVSGLGISSNDHIIVYTSHNCFSSARVWWNFKLFGHSSVSVLNGGLPGWIHNNGPIETLSDSKSPSKPPAQDFIAKLDPKLVATWQQVLEIVNTGTAQIVDARSRERFLAQAPEPRPGLPGGHIPGSLSLPFQSILQPDDLTKFRSVPEMRDAFTEAGVVLGSNVTFSCGSGVTASVLLFGLHLVGVDLHKLSVYDGSWTEWASNNDLPRMP